MRKCAKVCGSEVVTGVTCFLGAREGKDAQIGVPPADWRNLRIVSSSGLVFAFRSALVKARSVVDAGPGLRNAGDGIGQRQRQLVPLTDVTNGRYVTARRNMPSITVSGVRSTLPPRVAWCLFPFWLILFLLFGFVWTPETTKNTWTKKKEERSEGILCRFGYLEWLQNT